LTLPTNIILPFQNDFLDTNDPKDVQKYLQELKFSLQGMYEDIAQAVNGNIRSNYAIGRQNWNPILFGTTTAGSFTYTNRSGWSLRQGLLVDAWFDIAWSAVGGAAGNLYIELPYKVALTDNMPFVGVVQSSTLAYTGGTGIVINAISDSFRGEFWNVGTGFVTARQAVVANGRLIGHIRYMGQQHEPN
jgi:hypothetical protein